MRPTFMVIAAAFACAVLQVGGHAQADQPQVQWKIDRVTPSQSIQTTFEWRSGSNRSVWSNRYRAADLRGLDVSQLRGRGGPIQFALPRLAGTLDCGGRGGSGGGRGTCAFTPDAGFAALLAAQGLARPTWKQSLSLALSNVDRPLVDSLSQIRGLRPTVDHLVSMAIHGVSGEMVHAVGRARLPVQSAEDIVSLRIHGADAAWVGGLAPYAAQLRNLRGSDLVSLRVHGATPQWIGAVAAAMGPRFVRLSGDELTSMRIHGVRPEMIAAYVQAFGGALSGGDITSMAIHGVDASFIRRVAAAGHRNVTASELVSMRLHGISRVRSTAR